MNLNPTKQELENRISKLFNTLSKSEYNFDTAIIVSKVNQYYFTGTMQDGILIIRRDGKVTYFARKSYERAKLECPLDIIYKMSTYKDMLEVIPTYLGNTFIETEIVPISMLERIKKYFSMEKINSIDRIILSLRAIKSEYELGILTESGKQHQYLLENIVPGILKEGMSEPDFLTELYSRMVKLGHHGVSRFSMFQIELIVGQVGFGESSIYPTNFDGPGGMQGMSPAVPIIGNRKRYLKKGDLVFVDVGYGIRGYHSDKTQVYSYGTNPDEEVVKVHKACIDVLTEITSLIKINKIPSDIYNKIMRDLPDRLSQNFMGYRESVKFLGHGVGLHIDEMPVIANGFKLPLEENMVIALEPKCGMKGVGTVGVEETYVVKAEGAICLTGGPREIIVV
ncbi:MAG: peptidase M24 [Firmicutes bacterium HGW-Firmicutes-7]|nr:MAG: peptidase M24 [Firmicutes bacterium HGW-Firmicutes-7]